RGDGVIRQVQSGRHHRRCANINYGKDNRVRLSNMNAALMHSDDADDAKWSTLATTITQWGRELGFQHLGIADTELSEAEEHLQRWLAAGRHGAMAYMARHGRARSRPANLVPGTIRVITARMNYWPADAEQSDTVLHDGERAYIAR